MAAASASTTKQPKMIIAGRSEEGSDVMSESHILDWEEVVSPRAISASMYLRKLPTTSTHKVFIPIDKTIRHQSSIWSRLEMKSSLNALHALYCLAHYFAPGSSEHVVPDDEGGEKEVFKALCRDYNNGRNNASYDWLMPDVIMEAYVGDNLNRLGLYNIEQEDYYIDDAVIVSEPVVSE